jgi:hypothetical protein
MAGFDDDNDAKFVSRRTIAEFIHLTFDI